MVSRRRAEKEVLFPAFPPLKWRQARARQDRVIVADDRLGTALDSTAGAVSSITKPHKRQGIEEWNEETNASACWSLRAPWFASRIGGRRGTGADRRSRAAEHHCRG